MTAGARSSISSGVGRSCSIELLNLDQLALAHRTEECRASGLHDTLDGPAAFGRGTVVAFTVIDAKIVLEQPKLAIGLLMIAQRGAAGLDGIGEYLSLIHI